MGLWKIGVPTKPMSSGGCTRCIYNSMFYNRGESKIICDSPLLPCEHFKEPQASDMRRISLENPEWRKWHDEQEAAARARKYGASRR